MMMMIIIMIIIIGIIIIFPNRQKESWQTSEETSRHVRLERINKWPNSMTDI
jgi:competence protein ComGC